LQSLTDLPAEFTAKVNHGLASGVAGTADMDALISIEPEMASFGDMKFYKGATCHIPNALPLSVHLIVKYGSTDAGSCVEQAAIANAMMGGDSCTRALLIGLVLGARPGAVVPQRWVQVLKTSPISAAARASRVRTNMLAMRILHTSISQALPLSTKNSSIAQLVTDGKKIFSRLQQIPGMPDLIATMVAASNECMRAWEMGNEAEYRAVTTANFRMVIPAYGMDVTGFDNVWAIRKSMSDGPLDLHSQHSNYVNGNTVVALGTVFSRSTGKAQQHVEVKYTFDDSGKVAVYEQNIIWKE